MKKQFNLGDSVIALSSQNTYPNQPRTKGCKYTVTNLLYCETTGQQMINIDNTSAQTNSGFVICTCGKRHKSNGSAWTLSKYFVKDDPNAIEEELTEAIENENYEVAVVLRDVMQDLV